MNPEKEKKQQDRAFVKTANSAGRRDSRAGTQKKEGAGDVQTGSSKDTLEHKHTLNWESITSLLSVAYFVVSYPAWWFLCVMFPPWSIE